MIRFNTAQRTWIGDSCYGYGLITGILVLLLLIPTAPTFADELPNIVVITADDLGWMDLHCYGNERLDTPNLDRAIGRFLNELDAAGLAENTLVIFTSDNGAWGTDIRSLRGEKGHLWEGGIRVPWIVRWPGYVEAGSTCSTPIITTDTFPTLLEVVGLEADSDRSLDGVSIVPLLKKTGELSRDALYFHYPNYAFHKENRLGSAIREGHHKLILRYDDNSVELYDLNQELYDLKADPGESKNVIAEHPQVVAELRAAYDQWWDDLQPLLVNGDAVGPKINPLKELYWKQFGGSPNVRRS